MYSHELFSSFFFLHRSVQGFLRASLAVGLVKDRCYVAERELLCSMFIRRCEVLDNTTAIEEALNLVVGNLTASQALVKFNISEPQLFLWRPCRSVCAVLACLLYTLFHLMFLPP